MGKEDISITIKTGKNLRSSRVFVRFEYKKFVMILEGLLTIRLANPTPIGNVINTL
jgi:membrane protein CcdC involved in cytochrome C biogenesis